MIQLFVNAIISGSLLAVVSWSFGIIFSSTKIFHIAHAINYVVTVYLFLLFDNIIHVWFVSVLLALIGTASIAVLMELLIYRPLFKKEVNQNITLISSLGLQILGVNLIAMIAGNENQTLKFITNFSYDYGTIIITKVQYLQIAISTIVMIGLYLLFRFTDIGLKIRAVADKHIVASVLGINVLQIRNIVFILGSVVVGIAAILKAVDVGIDPNSGMNVVLSAIVVVILNKRDSIIGIVVISMIISLLHNLTEWYFSSEIKEAVTYFLLIVVMLFRTERILEYKMRVEEK
jgi:branched-chain amino acid transport system permease protein